VASWTIRDSLDLYNVLNWGSGFFAINDAGDVEVRPKTGDERSIDLLELVENLGRRGVHTPLLIRFNDILAYVQYERRPLIEKVRQIIERALRSSDISLEESAPLLERYEQGLKGYTYLSGQS
jgi:arginine decarboxylase-like protein